MACADSFNLHLSFSSFSLLFLPCEYCCMYNVILIVFVSQTSLLLVCDTELFHPHTLQYCKENFKIRHRCHYLLVFLAYAKSCAQPFSPQELPNNSDWFYFLTHPLFVAGVLLFGFVAILKLCVSLCTWIHRCSGDVNNLPALECLRQQGKVWGPCNHQLFQQSQTWFRFPKTLMAETASWSLELWHHSKI